MKNEIKRELSRIVAVYQTGMRIFVVDSRTGQQSKPETITKAIPTEITLEEFKEWTLEKAIRYISEEPCKKDHTLEKSILKLEEKYGFNSEFEGFSIYVRGASVSPAQLKTEKVGPYLIQSDLEGITLYTLMFDLNYELRGTASRVEHK